MRVRRIFPAPCLYLSDAANPPETGGDARLRHKSRHKLRSPFSGMVPLNRARVGSSIRLLPSRAGALGPMQNRIRMAPEHALEAISHQCPGNGKPGDRWCNGVVTSTVNPTVPRAVT